MLHIDNENSFGLSLNSGHPLENFLPCNFTRIASLVLLNGIVVSLNCLENSFFDSVTLLGVCQFLTRNGDYTVGQFFITPTFTYQDLVEKTSQVHLIVIVRFRYVDDECLNFCLALEQRGGQELRVLT